MKSSHDVKDNFIKTIESLDFSGVFVIDDYSGKEYTYQDVFSIALHMADRIRAGKSHVLAIMDNSIELFCLLLATTMTDRSVACLDPQKGPEEILGIVNESPDKVIAYSGMDEELKRQLPEENLFEVKADPTDTVPDRIQGEVLNRYKDKDFTIPYLITYTSGTSGKTKGVVHSFGSLLASAFSLDRLIPLASGNRLFHMMPMTYMAGILNSVFYPMIGGASIVIGTRFSIRNASSFWKKVDRYGADVFWVSPSMLKMIMMFDRTPTGITYCADHKVIFLVGTAALNESLRREFNEKYKVKVLAGYGLSETLFVSMETPDSLAERREGSVGVFLDEVGYEISDETELKISVPWMFLGYTNEDEKEYFAGEYYKSGDLVSVCNDQLYITGRKKDLIIKGGMNISPKRIEDCILSFPGILECAVFAVKPGGEEKICCAYVMKETADPSTEMKLRELVFDRLGRNYSVDYFWNIKELHRNLNGKIDKMRMSREWEEQNHA